MSKVKGGHEVVTLICSLMKTITSQTGTQTKRRSVMPSWSSSHRLHPLLLQPLLNIPSVVIACRTIIKFPSSYHFPPTPFKGAFKQTMLQLLPLFCYLLRSSIKSVFHYCFTWAKYLSHPGCFLLSTGNRPNAGEGMWPRAQGCSWALKMVVEAPSKAVRQKKKNSECRQWGRDGTSQAHRSHEKKVESQRKAQGQLNPLSQGRQSD